MVKISGWVAAKDGKAQPGRSGWRSPQSAPDFVLLAVACQARLARKDEQITAVSLNLIKNRWGGEGYPPVAPTKPPLHSAKASHSARPRLIGSNSQPTKKHCLRWSRPIGSCPRQGQESPPTSPHTRRCLGLRRRGTRSKIDQASSSMFHLLSAKYAARNVGNCAEEWRTAENTRIDCERRGWPSPQVRPRLCSSRISLSQQPPGLNPHKAVPRALFPSKPTQNPRPKPQEKSGTTSRRIRDPSPRLLPRVASTPPAQGPYFPRPAPGGLLSLFLPSALHLDPAGNPARFL